MEANFSHSDWPRSVIQKQVVVVRFAVVVGVDVVVAAAGSASVIAAAAAGELLGVPAGYCFRLLAYYTAYLGLLAAGMRPLEIGACTAVGSARYCYFVALNLQLPVAGL